MSDAEWFGPAYGKELDSGLPEGTLAVLEVEHAATPERVERARLLFKEASLSDFEPLDRKGRRWLHRATQREYLIDESQVLDAGDPRASGVEFFAIENGWQIVFFRARDFDPVDRVVLGTIVTGQLVRGRDGKDKLVPTKQGGTYDPDRMWVLP